MLDTTGATPDEIREAITHLSKRAARLSHLASAEFNRLHEEIGELQDELAARESLTQS